MGVCTLVQEAFRRRVCELWIVPGNDDGDLALCLFVRKLGVEVCEGSASHSFELFCHFGADGGIAVSQCADRIV